MQTLKSLQRLIKNVTYKNYEFLILSKEDGFLIQVQFMGADTDTGALELQKCRKWYVSSHSCDSEVIRTCFLAIRQAEEHELTENFRYKGIQVFNPHIDIDKLASFVSSRPFQVREKQVNHTINIDYTELPVCKVIPSDPDFILVSIIFPAFNSTGHSRDLILIDFDGKEHIGWAKRAFVSIEKVKVEWFSTTLGKIFMPAYWKYKAEKSKKLGYTYTDKTGKIIKQFETETK